jgi:WhiB family transcriptional regulator, redox-sensing transcriptional regulator
MAPASQIAPTAHGETKPAKRQHPDIICRCCGESRPNKGRGLCSGCWSRSERRGHPKIVPPPLSHQEQLRILNEERELQKRDREIAAPHDWAWQDDAACRDESSLLFFGPDGERSAERSIREAKAKRVCARCPVLAECLEGATDRGEKFGVFGGLNPEERMSRRRRIRRANAA